MVVPDVAENSGSVVATASVSAWEPEHVSNQRDDSPDNGNPTHYRQDQTLLRVGETRKPVDESSLPAADANADKYDDSTYNDRREH